MIFVDGFRISHSRVNNSPASCGFSLLNCFNIDVTSNEIARNAREGVRVNASYDIHFKRNLIEGNEADGVWLVGMSGKPRAIELSDNLIQYNGDTAVKGGLYVGAKLRANRDIGNKNPMPY